jgi:hypothetical protein
MGAGDGDLDAILSFDPLVEPPILSGDRARMSAKILVAVGRSGDTSHRRSCGSGGDRAASPGRTRSGSGCARHTGHVECARSQASMQLPWKKCLHAGSTRTTSPSSSSCRHTTHSTDVNAAALPLLPLLLLLPLQLPCGDGVGAARAL